MTNELFNMRQAMLYGGSWWFRWSVRLLILAAIVACGFIDYPYEIGGECRTLPATEIGIRAQVEGEIVTIHVDEGDLLRTGDPIVTLSSRDNVAALNIDEAELEEAVAELEQLRNGPRAEEIAMAEQSVKLWESELAYTVSELARLRNLATKQAVTQSVLERANKDMEVARSSLASAHENLHKLKEGTRPEEILAAEAKVKRITAERAHHKELVTLANITAPIPGRVVTSNIRERMSQYVKAGDLITVIHDTSRLRIEMAADESAAARVKVGMPASVRLNALDGRLMTGRVKKISRLAVDGSDFDVERVRSDTEGRTEEVLRSEDEYRVRVYIEFDHRPEKYDELVPGMTGYAKVSVGDDKLWRALLRPLQRFFYVEIWSWMP